jgi:hypothetical protein
VFDAPQHIGNNSARAALIRRIALRGFRHIKLNALDAPGFVQPKVYMS